MRDNIRKIKQYLKLLSERRWYGVTPVQGIFVCPCGYKTGNTPPPAEAFRPFGENETWGEGKDSHAWFRFSLPAAAENQYLRVSTDKKGWDATNPQFILYVNGEMRQGLDVNHREFLLDAGKPADVALYAYVGTVNSTARLIADVAKMDTDTDGLYYDILYPFEMLDFLNEESSEYAGIERYLTRAVSMLRFDCAEYGASVRAAAQYLSDEFYGKYCREPLARVACVGHTHIDCAWLWTLAQTREKVQRSFATATELMRHYPEYRFMMSQALLYQFTKEEAPELYEQIRQKIREGRWECEGSMWVEADCNIPDGESLVRQILYGKNFFKKEFGVENRVLWLPDVFGYSAALPQILRKAGIDWFVTSKISWNDEDRMPNDTFVWRGIDGTPIRSYFLTAQMDKGTPSYNHTRYEAQTDAQMISGTWKRYQQKAVSDEALMPFGFGDGGGGPTREYLELLRRAQRGIPGAPGAEYRFVGEFLNGLENQLADRPALPEWVGELYLEFHRGTYTTMSRNKRGNRKSEFLLRDTELWSTAAKALTGSAYPREQLHKTWETVLTNQFHDIIPGSSVYEVYEKSRQDYEQIAADGNRMNLSAKSAIADGVCADEGFVVFNPHGFAGAHPVKKDGVTVLPTGKIPPKGYCVVRDFAETNRVRMDGKTVETDDLRVRFDENWLLASVFDKKNGREVLKAGEKGNEIRIYQDYPDTYDAWEWQAYERDEYTVLTAFSSAEPVEDGIRRGIRIVRPYEKSTLTQTVWFRDTGLHIEFETVADWHEHHRMVKAAFPVDVNAEKATYEIQFGATERPTHFNTSWDRVKFEVCGQKYADLSEGNYGVSLCNDCKYGYDIHGGVMMLSLFRSPTYPNPEADQGLIEFTYALCPHGGALRESDTVEYAYYLNRPMELLPATGGKTAVPTAFTAADTQDRTLLCETVKQAEDSPETVLRFYACRNERGVARVKTDLPFEKAVLCGIMENEESELETWEHGFVLPYRGFEILTVKLK